MKFKKVSPFVMVVIVLLFPIRSTSNIIGHKARPVCGGVNIGFDIHNHPIIISKKNIGLLQSKGRNFLFKTSGETQITIQTDSTTTSIAGYIDTLVSVILPVIKNVYGSPFTSVAVKVTYDSTKFPWFYYNPVDSQMLISALPGQIAGSKLSPYDSLWDGVFTHELIHAFHTGTVIPDLAWFEEGLTECVSQMVMLILRNEKKRILSRAEPEGSILFYDTWNRLDKELVGGVMSPTQKLIPDMWYDEVSALFWMLTLSQSNGVSAGTWSDVQFIRQLNSTLLNLSNSWGGIAWPDEVINMMKAQTTLPIDGMGVEQWLGKQNVTYTQGKEGQYFGVCAHTNTFANINYGAVTNPEVLSILGIERSDANLPETPIINSAPIDIRIYNCADEVVWNNSRITVTLSDSSGINNVKIGQTQYWNKGAYRVEAKVVLNVTDTIVAESNFLVTGPMSSPDDIFNSAKDGLGIIILSPFETLIDSILFPVDCSFVWIAKGGAVLHINDLSSSEVSVTVQRKSLTQTFSIPNPFTRIVASDSPAKQFEKLLTGWPVTLSTEVFENLEWMGVDDVDGNGQKEVVVSGDINNGQGWLLNTSAKTDTGWPASGVNKLVGFYDFNNSPGKEIIFQSSSDSSLKIFKNNAEQIHFPFIYPVTSNLLFLNICGESLPDVIVGSNDSLFAYKHDGSMVAHYPIVFPDIPFAKIVALEGGDLNGDGKKEIVVVRGVPSGYIQELYISVIKEDGSLLSGWPKKIGYGWLDEDSGNQVEISFPLGDIDGDGKAEIVCTAADRVINRVTMQGGILTVFHLNGTTLSGFPCHFENANFMQTILADINGDRLPEIVTGVAQTTGSYFYDLYVFDAHGNSLPNCPQTKIDGRLKGIICGDIDGDQKPEIISSGNGIYLWKADGSSVQGSPYTQTYGWEQWYKLFSDPILTDLFGNGNLNLVARTDGGVYAWEMKSSYQDSLMEWPMFRYDNNHTSFYKPVNISHSLVRSSQSNPYSYRLFQNYPNPFNPLTTISFTLQKRSLVSLKVFDLLGREVATIVSEELSAGTYLRQWNAANISSGIYFYRLQAGPFTETKKLVLLK